MKVILLLVVIVAGAASLGVGMLSAPNIDVIAQNIGLGEGTISQSANSAALSVQIDRELGLTLSGFSVFSAFKDRIVDCVFRSQDKTVLDGTILICKLKDDMVFTDGGVIAEGKKILTADVGPGVAITIPINDLAFSDSNLVDFVHNIFIIVQEPLS